MMATFDLLPAIDLRNGRVVRLRQGDFVRETVYGDDPVVVAASFVAAGARWLHVVDLDAARDGSSRHAEAVGQIVAAVGDLVAVEVGGGLRTAEVVAGLLAAGAARAVVGTAALADAAFAAGLVAEHGPERVAVALDVRDDRAVGHGWVRGTAGQPVQEVVARLADAGVRWFEVTAIERDGTMNGPDLSLLARVVANPQIRVIASGGIRSVDDLRAVRAVGCAGAIVGRAVYDGALTITAALEATAGD